MGSHYTPDAADAIKSLLPGICAAQVRHVQVANNTIKNFLNLFTCLAKLHLYVH